MNPIIFWLLFFFDILLLFLSFIFFLLFKGEFNNLFWFSDEFNILLPVVRFSFENLLLFINEPEIDVK